MDRHSQRSGMGVVRRLAVLLGSAALLLPLAEPVGRRTGAMTRTLLAMAVTTMATPAQAQDPPPAAPEIEVVGLSDTVIPDGTSRPTADSGTNFGAVPLLDETGANRFLDRTFTIKNTGTANLVLSRDVQLERPSPSASSLWFSITEQPTRTIAANESTTFKVRLDPIGRAASGEIWVSIASNDADEGVYDFRIAGHSTAPELVLETNGASLPDGGSVDFGELTETETSADQVITISNAATGAFAQTLQLGDTPVTITGPDASEFTVIQPTATSIPVGDTTTTFTIRYTPTGSGPAEATVTVDPVNLPTKDFEVSGQKSYGTPVVTLELSQTRIEEAETVDIRARLDVPSLAETRITISAVSQRTPPFDINLSSDNVLVIPVGATESTNTVVLQEDSANSVDDGQRTVTVSGSATNDRGVTGPDPVMLTIDDNDTETIAPTVLSIVRQTPATSPTNADSLTWRITFSEDVVNVDAADFMVSGTTAMPVVAEVTAATVFDVTASGGDLASLDGTVTLGIASGQDITDTASTPNALTDLMPSGANEASYELDNTAPSIVSVTRQSPETELTNADSLTWRVTFSEAVVNVDPTDFNVTSSGETISVMEVTGQTGVWDVTTSGGILDEQNDSDIVALRLGATVDIEDVAGNALPDSANALSQFLHDNTAPTVASITRVFGTSPTNADALTWRVAFSEPVSGVEAADFTVSGTTGTLGVSAPDDGDLQTTWDVTVSGGNLDADDFNATVTLNFVTTPSIEDATGNALIVTTPTGTNDNSYVVDNTAPTVMIGDVPSTSTALFTATITFSESVTGFVQTDFVASNATLSNFTETTTGSVWTVDVTPFASGQVTLNIGSGVAEDAAGNGNTAATQAMSTYTATANTAPAFNDLALTRSVAENAMPGTSVGAPIPVATDADGDTLSYRMEGVDAVSFTFNAATRQIGTGTGVDYDFEVKETYSVTIEADDGKGGTDTVMVTINLTDVDEPPAAPTAPTVTAGSITSLTVNWMAPTNDGRPPINSYDLRYCRGVPSDCTVDSDFFDGPQDVTGTNTTIPDLEMGASYQVQVRASNAEGDSGWSDSGSGNTADLTNNAPMVTVEAVSSSVAEGTAVVFRVVADTAAQAGGLAVAVVVSETGDVVAGSDEGSRTVTIAAGQTLAEFTVATVDDDGDEAASNVTVTLVSDSANPATYAVGTPDAAMVTVNDNDTRGVTVSGSPVAVNEDSTATYTMVLDSEPTANVTITPSSNDTAAVTVSPAALTFTPANWQTAQMVTVTAIEDFNTTNEMVSISHDVSGADYASVTAASVDVIVTDDDTRGVTVSGSPLTINEGGTGFYTVVLTSRPTDDVTITPSLSGSPDVTFTPATITFTALNWNMPQPVSVTTQEDTDDVDDTATITHTVAGGDYQANNVTAESVMVTVSEIALPSVTIESGTLPVSEGMAAVFTLTRTNPTAEELVVGVSVTENGKVISGSAPTSVTFDAGATTATLSVPTDDDNVDEDAGTVTATVVGSSDPATYVLGASTSATLTVDDNDSTPVVMLLLSPDTITEAAGMGEIRARLSNPSAGETRVTVSIPAEVAGAVQLDADPVLVIPAGMTDSSNTVMLTAVDNDAEAPDLPVALSGVAVNVVGVTGPKAVMLTITDDETMPAEIEAKEEAKDVLSEVVLPDVMQQLTAQTTEVITSRLNSITSGPPGAPPTLSLEDVVADTVAALHGQREHLKNGSLEWQQAVSGHNFALPLSGLSLAQGESASTQDHPFSTLAIWGGGNYSSYRNTIERTDVDGNGFSGVIGMDLQPIPQLITGLVLTTSRWGLDYTTTTNTTTTNDARAEGTYEIGVTMVHPYVNWSATEQLSLWATFGYGRGEVEQTPEGEGATTRTDGFTSWAGGVRFEVVPAMDPLTGEGSPFGLAFKGDGATSSFLDTQVQLVRLAAEVSRSFAVENGLLSAALDLGWSLRSVSGKENLDALQQRLADKNHNGGAELAGSLNWLNADGSVSATVDTRVFLGGDHRREWGMGGQLRLTPSRRDGEGLTLTLQPSFGVTGTRLDELWSLSGNSDLAINNDPPGARLDARLAYGFPSGDALLTPYTEVAWEEGGSAYGAGLRYGLNPFLELDLKGTHRSGASGNTENRILLDVRSHL